MTKESSPKAEIGLEINSIILSPIISLRLGSGFRIKHKYNYTYRVLTTKRPPKVRNFLYNKRQMRAYIVHQCTSPLKCEYRALVMDMIYMGPFICPLPDKTISYPSYINIKCILYSVYHVFFHDGIMLIYSLKVNAATFGCTYVIVL